MPRSLRSSVPSRDSSDVGSGDFVRADGRWKEIKSNTAAGAAATPRSWTVTTIDGESHLPSSIERYAKAEDFQ